MAATEAMMTDIRPKTRNGVPAEVHALLTFWGNYTRRAKLGPMGFPAQSPFVRAALYGMLGIPQESNVRVEDSDPALVEWIQKIVDAMPEDPQEIILMQYRPPLKPSGNEPSFDEKAKMLCMSTSTFRSRLEGAQWYVFAKMYP